MIGLSRQITEPAIVARLSRVTECGEERCIEEARLRIYCVLLCTAAALVSEAAAIGVMICRRIIYSYLLLNLKATLSLGFWTPRPKPDKSIAICFGRSKNSRSNDVTIIAHVRMIIRRARVLPGQIPKPPETTN